MRSVLAAFKLALFFLWCVLLVPFQAVLLLFYRGKAAYIIPCLWQRGVCRIFGIKVSVEGEPSTDTQAIYVGNHLSYLDIPVIGSVLKASFVAKNDVASWPVFGFLSKMQQTAFISRSRNHASHGKNDLGRMMDEGKSLVLFPEGTSTDGREVLPFKSSLFSLALQRPHHDLVVQPFTLSVDRVEGRVPQTQEDRDIYAWHRDMTMELPEHLWHFARSKGVHVTLYFHPPLSARSHTDRKILAKACHDNVSRGLNSLQIST